MDIVDGHATNSSQCSSKINRKAQQMPTTNYNTIQSEKQKVFHRFIIYTIADTLLL
jgi:hypothetical protein